LGNNLINNTLFALEKKIFLKSNFQLEKHLFITGLPRSGTTFLLNIFYSTELFGSCKYSHMPMILSPNFSKIFKRSKTGSIERYHNDGIKFDYNAPEAFDEVFFKIFKNKQNFNDFTNFISLVLISENKKRYLSKNNSNYKRINSILDLLPNASFLIPIRDPINHSFSLMSQHFNFLKLHKKFPFSQRYMSYLGHFEFGNLHKYWYEPVNFNNPNNLNYWLEQWNLFYENIYFQYKDNDRVKFIIYDKLDEKDYFNEIKEFFKLNINNDNFTNKTYSDLYLNKKFDSINLKKSKEIYANYFIKN